MPVLVNGKYPVRVFTNKEDIMEALDILIKDIKYTNEQTGKTFNVSSSAFAYIPQFTCPNHFLDQKMQNDINRFVFSKEYKIPPYEGSYGSYPRKWIEKCNKISESLEIIKQRAQDKANRSK